jgi:hypothetical protein
MKTTTTLQLLPMLALMAGPVLSQESSDSDPFVRVAAPRDGIRIAGKSGQMIVIHQDGRKEIIREDENPAEEQKPPTEKVEQASDDDNDSASDTENSNEQHQEGSGIVSVRFEVFSLGVDEAGDLARGKKSDEALYNEIVAKIKKKEAKQETLLIVRSKPGETASVESTRDQIYATDYRPATILTADNETPGDSNGEAPRAEGKAGIHEVIPATPTSFETRKTGWTMEVQPQDQEGDRIDLAFSATYVAKVGTTIQGEGLSKTEMPVFETQKFETQFDNFDGVPSLCGTMAALVAPGSVPPDRVWFAFLTATNVKR